MHMNGAAFAAAPNFGLAEVNEMNFTKKLFSFIRNCVELYIPIAAFLIMFGVFCAQIFCRYILRMPLQWAYEVTVTCYLWMVILGACYAQRSRSHVSFTLIYDKLPLRLRALTSFLGNALIAVAFIWTFIPNVQMIQFQAKQLTSVLKIGLNIVYAPFIPFQLIIILYVLYDMYKDFRVFAGLAKPEEIQMMIDKNLTESQEAIREALNEAKDEEGME